MNEHRVGYRRVSTSDQNLDRQDLGDVEKVFEDKASGSSADRPGLVACLSYLRPGDTLVVHSMDRLARSLLDLEKIVTGLVDRGVSVEFLKERLVFSPGEDDPFATCYRQILGAIAQMERSLIRVRQREGIDKAKERGVYKGRTPALSVEDVRLARQRRNDGTTLAALVRDYGCSKATMQNALAGTGVYSSPAYAVA